MLTILFHLTLMSPSGVRTKSRPSAYDLISPLTRSPFFISTTPNERDLDGAAGTVGGDGAGGEADCPPSGAQNARTAMRTSLNDTRFIGSEPGEIEDRLQGQVAQPVISPGDLGLERESGAGAEHLAHQEPR